VYLSWLGRQVAFARWFAAAGAALILLLAATNPPTYHQKAIFNLVFFEFAPKAPDPRAALAELGMQPADAVALGMHAFEPKYPANDPGWCERFNQRARFAPVLLYYVKHPVQVARHIAAVLTENLHEVRADNLANFRRQDGVQPGALSRRWNWWSAAQERLYALWPGAILLVYAGALALAMALHRRAPAPAELLLAVIAFGVAEFLIASLADVLDTGRHLRVFHAVTDLLVVASAAIVANWLSLRARPSS
jgi:hypothetical protein